MSRSLELEQRSGTACPCMCLVYAAGLWVIQFESSPNIEQPCGIEQPCWSWTKACQELHAPPSVLDNI